ncbi:hypothetical protein BJ875DRAFT_545434 [Amylocarpus encephaloides]|uniref:2EXR domain-containing protein n=1 Tax=Amylocarpus encephaloides TaxID=45428 RepID=A0A9P7YDY8_9HELO|nr:hypothetical protein BJ875DRAFT_545434 [Amylocarpus encephaloides]
MERLPALHNGDNQLGQYSGWISVNQGEAASTPNNGAKEEKWIQGLAAGNPGPFLSICGTEQAALSQQMLAPQIPPQQTPCNSLYGSELASFAAGPANHSNGHHQQVDREKGVSNLSNNNKQIKQEAVPRSQYFPTPAFLSGDASGSRTPDMHPASLTHWEQEKLRMVEDQASGSGSQEGEGNPSIQYPAQHYPERVALVSGANPVRQNPGPTTTLKDFPKIPVELRTTIWELALDAVSPVEDRNIHFSTLPGGNGGVQQNAWFSINRRPGPDFLSFRNICSESRRVCTKSFPDYGKDIVDWMGLRFPLYIDFSKDTLVFDVGKGLDHLVAIGQAMGRENCLKVKSICKITGSPLMHFWVGKNPQDLRAEKTHLWHSVDQLAMIFKTFPCLETIKLLPSRNKTPSNDDRKLLHRFKYDGRGFRLEEYYGPFLQEEYRWAIRNYSNAWHHYLDCGGREAVANVIPRCPRIVMVTIQQYPLA